MFDLNKVRNGGGGAGKTGVSERFKGVDASQVKKKSNIFEGKEIYVGVGGEMWTKNLIEEKVVENGGDIVQNPGPATFCVVTSKIIHKIKNYIDKVERTF